MHYHAQHHHCLLTALQVAVQQLQSLEALLGSREAVVLVGPPLSGKTVLWKLLLSGLNRLANHSSADTVPTEVVAHHVRVPATFRSVPVFRSPCCDDCGANEHSRWRWIFRKRP